MKKYQGLFDTMHECLRVSKKYLVHSKNKNDELAGELACQLAEVIFQTIEYSINFEARFLKQHNLTKEQLEASAEEYRNRFSHLSPTNPIRIKAESHSL